MTVVIVPVQGWPVQSEAFKDQRLMNSVFVHQSLQSKIDEKWLKDGYPTFEHCEWLSND